MEGSEDIKCNILSKEDFDNICRCCLSSSTLGSIFELMYEGTMLDDIFYSLFGAQLDVKDDLPKKICETCIAEVIHCYNFKKSYEASEATLLNISAVKVEYLEVETKLEPLEHNYFEEPPVETQHDEKNITESKVETRISDLKENEQCDNTETKLEQEVKWKRQLQKTTFAEQNIRESKVDTKTSDLKENEQCDNTERELEQEVKKKRHSQKTTFPSRLEHYQHRKLIGEHDARKHPCEICGKVLTKRTLWHHFRTHDPVKRYSCDQCDAKFATSGNLCRHKMTHTGEKRYVCEFCGKGYIQLTSLTAHRRSHSTKNTEKSFACEFCYKRFAHHTSLRSHQYSHTGERPYACCLCPKKFTRCSNLNRHIIVHTGKKPHVCNFCGKSFTEKFSLTLHVRLHTGEKPYKCDLCTARYCVIRDLKRHKERKHQQV